MDRILPWRRIARMRPPCQLNRAVRRMRAWTSSAATASSSASSSGGRSSTSADADPGWPAGEHLKAAMVAFASMGMSWWLVRAQLEATELAAEPR